MEMLPKTLLGATSLVLLKTRMFLNKQLGFGVAAWVRLALSDHGLDRHDPFCALDLISGTQSLRTVETESSRTKLMQILVRLFKFSSGWLLCAWESPALLCDSAAVPSACCL